MRYAPLFLATFLWTGSALQADNLIGRIVDVNGVGIANGDIDMRNDDTGDDLILTGDSSDANGFFNVTVPPGNYRVTVQGPVGAGMLEFFFRRIEIVGTYDFGTLVMEMGHTMTGRVVDQNGFPVAACDLDVFSNITGAPLTVSGARTDLFGNYTIFVPENIRIHYDPRNVFGVTLAPKSLDYLVPVDTAVPDVTLLPGHTVSGTVRRPNGQLVTGASLDFTDPLGNTALTYGDHTDLMGNFSVVVAADTWEVRICPPAGTTLAPLGITDLVVSTSTSLGTLTLPAGVLLHGTLTDQDGLRVAGADVDVLDAATGVSMTLCGDGSSPIGNYGVRVPAGTYHVLFRKPGLLGVRRDVVLTTQTRVDETLVPCPPASSLVHNGNGVNPLALVSTSTPRIAKSWDVQLDCSGHAASFGVVLLHEAAHPGFATFAGELLVSGALFSVQSKPHAGDVITFQTPIAPNTALCGLSGVGQGLILGSPGPQLTNALLLTIGY